MGEILIFLAALAFGVLFILMRSERLIELIFEAREELKRKRAEGQLSALDAALLNIEAWRMYLALAGCGILATSAIAWSNVRKTEPPSLAEDLVVLSLFVGLGFCIPLMTSLFQLLKRHASR